MSTSLHSHQYDIFRTLLIAARQDSGLTQVQIAASLNKPQSFISKYERGERRLDFAEFMELASVLNIDTVAFIAAYQAALVTKAHVSRYAHPK